MAKVVKPSRRKQMAQGAVRSRNVSISFACQLFVVSESCYRYQPQLNEENEVIADWLLRIYGQSAQLGIWPVLFVPAQRKRLPLQPQKGVPDLLRTIAEHANKAEKKTETG